MKKWIAILGGLLFSAGAHAETVYRGPLVNETALTYGATYQLNLSERNIDFVSFQANFSTGPMNATTFTDGRASTASITIAKIAYQSYTQSSATNTVRIASNTVGALSGAVITLNGTALTEGTHWARKATSTDTLVSLVQAMNTVSGFSTQSNFVSTVAFSTCTTPGTFGNQFTLTSSTPAALVVGAPTYVNGRDNASLIINNTRLTQGTDWTATDTASTTAKNLSAAIMANTTLNSIVSSTWSMIATSSVAVVTATATSVGTVTNYALISSTPSILVLSQSGTMVGGTNSDISTGTSQINKTNSFGVGLPVLFTVTSGAPPANLVTATTYYVTNASATVLQLSTSKANAIAGTAISISSQVPTGGSSFSLSPTSYTINAANQPGLQWQVSNDATNWTNYSSSFTYNVLTSTIAVWNFGQIGYNYIRALVAPPLSGGVRVTVPARGDQNR